jgi:amidase
LRIAFSTSSLTGAPIHADCVRAVQEAAKLCSELGHEVAEAAPPIDGEKFSKAFLTVWAVGCARGMEGNALVTGRKPQQEDFEELTWALAEQGRSVSATSYLLTVTFLQGIARKVARFLTQYDVWLTPVLAEPPLPLGSFVARSGDPLHGLRRAVAFVPYTPICNVTGQPAMSVPLFWNDEGLPIGTHFAGRFGEESTLFRLAAQLEAARPWMIRRPKVW